MLKSGFLCLVNLSTAFKYVLHTKLVLEVLLVNLLDLIYRF